MPAPLRIFFPLDASSSKLIDAGKWHGSNKIAAKSHWLSKIDRPDNAQPVSPAASLVEAALADLATHTRLSRVFSFASLEPPHKRSTEELARWMITGSIPHFVSRWWINWDYTLCHNSPLCCWPLSESSSWLDKAEHGSLPLTKSLGCLPASLLCVGKAHELYLLRVRRLSQQWA